MNKSPLPAALDAIAALGFTSIDLLAVDGWNHVHPSELAADYDGTLARTRAALQRAGLTLGAINTGVSPQTYDRSPEACAARDAETRAIVRFMRDMGVTVASLQPRQIDPSRPLADVMEDTAASLREMVAIANEAGVVLALENHIQSVAETLDGALWLLDAVPGLRLAYDPSHLAAQEINPQDAIALMDAAAHVHLRDAAPGKIQVPFGQGTLDLGWVLRAFLERGYRGHVAIEYLGDGEPETMRSVAAARELAARYWPDA